MEWVHKQEPHYPRILAFANWTASLQEPERVGVIADVVCGSSLEVLSILVVFFMIAVLNVVTSVFVEATMAITADEPELTESHFANLEAGRNMLKVCEHAHPSMTTDYQGFVALLRHPEMVKHLARLGIDVKEPKDLFQECARHSRVVDLHEFVRTCIKLQGTASTFDLHMVRHHMSDAMSLQMHWFEGLAKELSELHARFAAPAAAGWHRSPDIAASDPAGNAKLAPLLQELDDMIVDWSPRLGAGEEVCDDSWSV